MRADLGGRPLDATEVMSKLKIPVLVTHGDEDRNSKVGTAEYTAKTIPGAKLSVYEGIGHAPFYEDAARFNTELAAFVRGPTRRTDVLALPGPLRRDPAILPAHNGKKQRRRRHAEARARPLRRSRR